MKRVFASLSAIGLLFLAGNAVAQTDGEPAPAPGTEPPPASAEMPAPAEAEPPPPPTTATVHVIAENVESDKGTVWLALCDTSLSVEGCPYKKSAPASAGFVEITFDDIPPGDYAVVGFHDVNNNEKFDRLVGVPREPYALSGAAADELVPGLADALLPIKVGENDVIIRMKRLGG